jgi:TIR domain
MTVPISPHSPAPIDVFISYSHKDDDLRSKLVTHLSSLKRQRKIADWFDREIEAGSEWEAQLKNKLESSPVILLLISADFLASDYCYDIEMKRAIERHKLGTALVIPIILRPCDLDGSAFMELQALPKDLKPITQWDDQDLAFLDVAKGIRRAVESLPSIESKAKKERVESVFITGTPIEHPRQFFGREKELKRLFNLLKTRPLQNAAIIGKRRSGKTSLLNYLSKITTTPVAELRPGQRSDWLPNPETYRWIFVDFQDARMAQRERLLRYLLESMELPVPKPCNLESFMDQVSGQVLRPTVILLDEIGVGLQRCPELDDEFWESLRSLATTQTGGNLAFVLATPESPIDLARNTGHSSPFFNIFGYTTTLTSLMETEARELVASSPLPFSESDTEWILSHGGRWPLLLQILCSTRLFYLEDENLSDDWQIESLEQTAKFHGLLN